MCCRRTASIVFEVEATHPDCVACSVGRTSLAMHIRRVAQRQDCRLLLPDPVKSGLPVIRAHPVDQVGSLAPVYEVGLDLAADVVQTVPCVSRLLRLPTLDQDKAEDQQYAIAVRLSEAASLFGNEPRQCGFVAS